MVRARLALLALGGSLLLTSGCSLFDNNRECSTGTGSWFSRFRLASRNGHGTSVPCECEGGALVSHGEGPVVVPPNTFVAPVPGLVTPPANQQPPRIIPVPQANPMPYTPPN